MRSAVLLEPCRIEVRETEVPVPGPGEVVLRVRSALTCGADVRAWRAGAEAALGHEFAGVVERVGEGVRGFREGDEVMTAHTAPCGACFYCERGQENLCEAKGLAVGGFAEFVRVPASIVTQNMFRKPRDLSFAEAAFLEPLSCVVHALEGVPVEPRDTVVILGTGAIGLLFLALVKTAGPRQVIVAGRGAARLALAREMGADRVVDTEAEPLPTVVMQATGNQGAEVVIECTGHPETWRQTVELASRGSHVVLFGGCPRGVEVAYDTTRLHYDQITMVGSYHFTPRAVRRAYELLGSGAVRPGLLVSGRVRLQDLPATFERLDRGDGVKFEVVPGEN